VLTAAGSGCATTGANPAQGGLGTRSSAAPAAIRSANRPREEALADIYYTPIGICTRYTATTPAHQETGANQIFVVARIDSIYTPTAFTFDPARLYIGSPGQTQHGGAFDLEFTTAQPTPVPAGGLPYSLGDMAVAYRTADARDVYIDHSFRLAYDGRGALVHQSHADTRATERPTCGDASVFTG
jgi:hypothetical protein